MNKYGQKFSDKEIGRQFRDALHFGEVKVGLTQREEKLKNEPANVSLGDAISEQKIKNDYKSSVKERQLKSREKKLFELAQKSKEETGWKTIRERNEKVPLVDETHDMGYDLETVHHRKFSTKEFLAKIESGTFKIDDFDKIYPGKEFK